jgi:tRNA dimethylallyltransferase
MKVQPLVSIMGPTGIGKTNLAFGLFDKIDLEIISVDSVQIYKHLNIGSGKPTKNLLSKYPHKLVNILEPTESYSAARFNREAMKEILLASKNKKLPLLVGGTMLYFKSLLGGLSAMPETDPLIREKLKEVAKKEGWQSMHKRLKEVDPVSGLKIHPHDTQRILRALEVFESSKKTLTDWHKENKKMVHHNLQDYKLYQFAIEIEDRELHKQIITDRFNSMIQEGLIEEVERLLNLRGMNKDSVSMRSIGYRQICEFLDDKISFDEMVFKGVSATKQLAKRQMTWLRSWENIIWLKNDPNTMASIVLERVLNDI